ncbi:hypothetical protein RB195_002957 [Necator americanus]|uniref:ShKT domain-containing protein n=1 Tax=Necator americanus TaxID=51031 RepID=A0ABR1DLM4_NECAM
MPGVNDVHVSSVKHLTVSHQNVIIKKFDDAVTAHTQVESAIHVQANMENIKTVYIQSREKSSITAFGIEGCCSCLFGANVTVVCHSTGEQTTPDNACNKLHQTATCTKMVKINRNEFSLQFSKVSSERYQFMPVRTVELPHNPHNFSTTSMMHSFRRTYSSIAIKDQSEEQIRDTNQKTIVMLLYLIYAAIVQRTSAGIVDLNCTYTEGENVKFSEGAVICPNVLDDSVCEKLYETEAKLNGADDRDAKCYKNGDAVDASFKKAAISNCPRRCGYCCMTPEYSCPNKQCYDHDRNQHDHPLLAVPRIKCSAVTKTMCQSSIWRNIITEDCPNVCGFCKTGNCTDIAPDCDRDTSICGQVGMQTFVKEYCRRTCGFCSEASTRTTNTPTTASEKCNQLPSQRLRADFAAIFALVLILEQT